MLNKQKRVGRPKGKTPPKTATERYKASMQKLKDSGGKRVNVALSADEVAILADLKQKWLMPINATEADVIKAMTVVLSGSKLITRTLSIEAVVTTHTRR